MGKNFSNIKVVLGSFGIQLILGYFYLWSPISAYVTSYYRQKGQNISNELTNIIQPSLAYAKTLAMPFSAVLSQKFGDIKTTSLFALILYLAYLHSSTCDNFWSFYIDYSIIGGIVNGVLLMLPICQIQKHFTHYKGVATGIAFSGYGLGSIIWSQVSYNMINPNNLSVEIDPITKKKFFPQEVCDNVPNGMKLLGLIFFIGLIVCSLIAFTNNDNDNNNNNNNTNKINKNQQNQKGKKYTQLLFSKNFLIICLLAIFSSLFPMMIINNYKQIGLDLFNDDKFITMVVVTAAAIASGIARIIWGYFYDKTGYHISFQINLALQSLIILAYTLLTPSKLQFTIVVTIAFFCQAGTSILLPLFTLELFGFNDGQKIYGFVHYALSSANLLQYFIVYYFKDQYGFSVLSQLFLACNFVAYVIKKKNVLILAKKKIE